MAIKSVAVVTGASQGIGRATALRLARDFAAMVLVARDKGNLEITAAEIDKIRAVSIVYALDLRQPQAAETVIKGTLEQFGRIDALLNIAGAVPQIDLFEMTDAQWDDGMTLKLHGARRISQGDPRGDRSSDREAVGDRAARIENRSRVIASPLPRTTSACWHQAVRRCPIARADSDGRRNTL